LPRPASTVSRHAGSIFWLQNQRRRPRAKFNHKKTANDRRANRKNFAGWVLASRL
jgi:hypothetical protein